jgi:GT2 family glycosyltransferase
MATLATQLPPPSCEIVVVDNASFDDCGEMLAREFPAVRFVQADTNLGFAGANNLGARLTTAPVLMFLNPDTEVHDGALHLLFQAQRSLDDLGVLGCRLLNSDGTLQHSCVQSFPTVLNQLLDSEVLRRHFPASALWGTKVLHTATSSPLPVAAISGASMVIRRPTFERIGGFSERYFMYGEDMDLCWRLQAAGLRNYFLPSATILHHGGGSSRQAPSTRATVIMRRSISEFLRASRGNGAALGYRGAMLFASLVRMALLCGQLPFASVTGRHLRWWGAFRKWAAIFGWALGFGRNDDASRLSTKSRNHGQATSEVGS